MAKKVLTAEEILKMPEDDYMNAQQLEFFRRRLTDLEKELRANADQTTVNLRETTVVPDPADRARSMHLNCARVTVNASC